MSRVQARLRVVAIIALVLVLAGASTAGAGPLTQGSTPTVGTATHWLDTVSAWIGGLFDFSAGQSTKTDGKAPQGPSNVTDPLGGNAHLNNGSCIDPMGGPRCSA